jgi:hypothetical protein
LTISANQGNTAVGVLPKASPITPVEQTSRSIGAISNEYPLEQSSRSASHIFNKNNWKNSTLYGTHFQ